MKTWTRVSPGIYRHKAGSLYSRPVINGRPTWRKLGAGTVAAAHGEIALARANGAPDPGEGITIGSAIDGYLAAGCPDAQRQARAGVSLSQEQSRLKILKPFWAGVKSSEINMRKLDSYADSRMKRPEILPTLEPQGVNCLP